MEWLMLMFVRSVKDGMTNANVCEKCKGWND